VGLREEHKTREARSPWARLLVVGVLLLKPQLVGFPIITQEDNILPQVPNKQQLVGKVSNTLLLVVVNKQ
jgi:hypothetical protein